MNTSDVLNKAADLIEERGWTNGAVGWNYAGQPLCFEGGILAALGLDADVFGSEQREADFRACPAYVAVWDYLQTDTRWGIFRDHIYAWNDMPRRTATEVIEVLRATAVIEAAREQAADTAAAPTLARIP